MNQIKKNNILALDVGAVRIGLAMATYQTHLVRPLDTILNDENLNLNLKKIITDNNINVLVVGLPRNLAGEKTLQTEYVEKFVTDELKQFKISIVYQDETLTSVKAQELLEKSGKIYKKSDIDTYSASLILEDYLMVIKK